MLIDATHAEETRVVVVEGNKVEEFDFESENRRQLAGNIYLAKVTRIEPSLQAAFIDYGGNRHGFLAFSEIHPDYYQIPVADREALMAEERAYSEAMRRKDDEDEVAETDFMSEEDVNANQEQSKTGAVVSANKAVLNNPDESDGVRIKSPIIGTAYLAPEPGAKKFVNVGDKIKKGQTIMIVEAMKTMNHVPSTSDGEVKKILVQDGQPVEFGQTLVILK